MTFETMAFALERTKPEASADRPMAATLGRDPEDRAAVLDIVAAKFDVNIKAALLLLGVTGGYSDESIRAFKKRLPLSSEAMHGWVIERAPAWMREGLSGELKLRLAQRSAYWTAIALELQGKAEGSRIDAADATPAPSGSLAKEKNRIAVVAPLLARKGLTKSSWADKAGVDPSVVYDYMAGKSSPRPANRNALAEVIGLPELPE